MSETSDKVNSKDLVKAIEEVLIEVLREKQDEIIRRAHQLLREKARTQEAP